jgi:murein peptide amidase A
MTRSACRTVAPAAVMTLCCLLAVSCANGHREPYTGVEPAVRDLAGFESDLRAAVGEAPGASLVQAGMAAGEFDAPVWLVRIERQGASRRVLLCAGIHGNEPAGPAFALEAVRSLCADASLFPDASFDVVALLNPWGWSRDVRYDRAGIDPNRDFATFASDTARAVRQVAAGRRYDLVLDHHEDPDAKGFYLYQYADPDTRPTRGLIAKVKKMGFPVEQDVRMVILRTRDGLIEAPRWGLWYMRASRRLSMSNWLRLEGAAKVYTVETPTLLPLEDRLLLHRTAFEALVSSALSGGVQ